VSGEEKSELVLLHGWGTHPGIWQDLADRLAADFSVRMPELASEEALPSMADVVDRLAAASPRRCMVAGWSLGGQLALAWAQRHPQQIERIVLLASTPRFVAAPDWPEGLAAAIFAEFTVQLETDPAGTLKRFRLLQASGDTQARAVARRLEAVADLQRAPEPEVLERTLGWLGSNDLRDTLPAVAQPVLLLHGTEDRLVNPAASAYMLKQMADARMKLISGAAHAPFISQPDKVCRQMIGFFHEQ